MEAALSEPSSPDEKPHYLRIDDPAEPHGLGRLLIHRKLAWNIFRMAMPVVLGMVTQTAINILDTVMVGRLPTEIANPGQAAIGFSLPLMWLVSGSLSAVWVGTQAIASRRFGAGELDEAGKVLSNSVAIALASSVLVSVLAYAAVPSLVTALYDDPATVNLGVDYLRARLVGVLAMVTTFSFKSFFDGIGRTHYFLGAAIVMNVLNVVLNYLFIFGNEALGIPLMGVQGAAWASVISAYVGLLALFVLSLQPSLLRRFRYFRPTDLDLRIVRDIVRLSVPNAAATIVIMVGFSAFYWVVGQVNDRIAEVGNPVIATASQAVVTLNMVTFMTALAFGSATASLVGQSVGAKRPYLGERYGWEAAKLWAYAMWGFGALTFIFPDFFIGLINPDLAVIEAARNPVRLLSTIQGIIAIAMIFAQTLYGTGEAKFVMMVEFALHLGVMAPGAYLFGLVLDMGLLGVYIAPTIYGTALAVATLLRFKSGRWKTVAF